MILRYELLPLRTLRRDTKIVFLKVIQSEYKTRVIFSSARHCTYSEHTEHYILYYNTSVGVLIHLHRPEPDRILSFLALS